MPDTSFVPAEIAARWRCSTEHVLRQIRSGKLRATAINPGSPRPRWRVSIEDLERFEAAGSNQPAPKPRRRKRNSSRVYY